MFKILAELATGKIHLVTTNHKLAGELNREDNEDAPIPPVWLLGGPTKQTAVELAAALERKFGVTAKAVYNTREDMPRYVVEISERGLTEFPLEDEEPDRNEQDADPLQGQRMDSADVEGS